MEEESPYSSIKESLSSVPAKALNYSSRLILANNLDYKQVLLSERGFARDYKGLAELIGFPYNAIKMFEEFENRTMKILESWETRPDATLDKLIGYLEDMDRHDVIEDLIPSLKKNVAKYLEYQKSLEIPIQVPEVTSGPLVSYSKRGVLTFDDLKNKECTIYDAYVSYAEEDGNIAAEFSRFLESPKVGIKLFIRGRDMLAGCPELDTDIELIKNRCRHMLILLTPNFIKSPALDFQVSFAGSLAIEQKQRILIPVVLAPCEIPPILNTVSKIDFTKEYTQDWMRNKLIASLLPEENMASFFSSLGNNSLKSWNIPTQAICASPSPPSLQIENKPVITFPPTEKITVPSVSNFSKILTISPGDISDNDPKDSSASNFVSSVICQEVKEHSKSSSNKFQQFFSILKKKGSSSSSPSSFSSNASSGYHSQSCSHLESLENS